MAKMNTNIRNKWVEVYGTIILIWRQTVFHESLLTYSLSALLNQQAHKIYTKLNNKLLHLKLLVCSSIFDSEQILSNGIIQIILEKDDLIM